MTEERHFALVEGRQVFYRRFGSGPAVFVLHGSPQASRAVRAVAEAVAARGLCAIAPDTPGAGRSEPLPGDRPTSADYARRLAALADGLGLKRVGLYGFHTGATTACAFAGLFPGRTAALALEGLPAWSAAERADFTARYLPPFEPRWDGSHMAWLWARMEEQSLFFPWHAPTSNARMSYPVSAKEGVHANCMDLLDAGDAYRSVYQAAFDFRPEDWLDRLQAPTLIAATAFDVLRDHLDRPPLSGRGRAFDTADALHGACADLFASHRGDQAPPPPAARSRGFVQVGGEALAWRMSEAEGPVRVRLHSAGGRLEDFKAMDGSCLDLDLPGHGDSAAGWLTTLSGLSAWTDAVDAACGALGVRDYQVEGFGAGGAIGADLVARGRAAAAVKLGPGAGPPPPLHFGSVALAPEWDGAHLVRAWRIARWERLYDPWYARTAAHARKPFDDLDPALIQRRALSLLKAHDRWLGAAALEA